MIVPELQSQKMVATLLVMDVTLSSPVSSAPTPIPNLTPAKLLAIARSVKYVLGLSGDIQKY